MFKKQILLAFILPMLALTANSCGHTVSDEEYFKNFNPVVRFAVTSDCHISVERDGDSDYGAIKLKKLYKAVNDYAKTQPFKEVNRVIVVGDGAHDAITRTTENTSMKKFWDITKQAEATYGIKTDAIMGNHEFLFAQSDQKAIDDWKSMTGYQNLDFSFEINGYHFIMFSLRHGDVVTQKWLYDDVNQSRWLDNEIKKALDSDPSKSKPIFVFQHIGVKETCYGTKLAYMETIDETSGEKIPAPLIPAVLKKYPQVVDFSGHSHFATTDPRIVMQKDFTSIGTGSLDDIVVDLAGLVDDDVHAIDEYGGCVFSPLPHRVFGGNYFWICEADAAGALKVMPYNLTNNYFGSPWLFRSFKSTNDFKYTAKRQDTDPLCEFQNVQIAAPTITKDTVTYVIPQVKNAQHYRCELYKGDELVDIRYRLRLHWHITEPNSFTVPFTNLTPNTTYKIKIYAVNSWAKETCDNYNLSFTTLN